MATLLRGVSEKNNQATKLDNEFKSDIFPFFDFNFSIFHKNLDI